MAPLNIMNLWHHTFTGRVLVLMLLYHSEKWSLPLTWSSVPCRVNGKYFTQCWRLCDQGGLLLDSIAGQEVHRKILQWMKYLCCLDQLLSYAIVNETRKVRCGWKSEKPCERCGVELPYFIFGEFNFKVMLFNHVGSDDDYLRQTEI